MSSEMEEKRKQREAEKGARRAGNGMTGSGRGATGSGKGATGFTIVFITRSKSRESGYAPQHSESTANECTVCFGNYSNDLSADGTPGDLET